MAKFRPILSILALLLILAGCHSAPPQDSAAPTAEPSLPPHTATEAPLIPNTTEPATLPQETGTPTVSEPEPTETEPEDPNETAPEHSTEDTVIPTESPSLPPEPTDPTLILPTEAPTGDTTVPTLTLPTEESPQNTLPTETAPPATLPQLTLPSDTLPAVTLPTATAPEVTQPITTAPAVTTPTIALPTIPATEPPVTGPAATAPSPTIPDPEITEPQETAPIVTIPPVTEPPLSQPAATEAPVTTPSPTAPKPVETQPPATEPPVTAPAETRPAPTEPSAIPTEPQVTEPTVTAPAETDPAPTDPPETQPPVTEPEETTPVQTQPIPTQCPHNYLLSDSRAADCTTPNSETYICSECGDIQANIGEALGHRYNLRAICTRCGEAEPGPITVTIQIRDSKNNRVSGAGVRLWVGDALLDSGTTDSDGIVRLSMEHLELYNITLHDVPAGLGFNSSYTFSTKQANITLTIQPILDSADHSNANYSKGSTMADFTLSDTDGIVYNLFDLLAEKELVILDFWYCACTPCKNEFPYFDAALDRYGSSISLLAVNPLDTMDSIVSLRQELGVRFPMLRDTVNLFRGFGVTSYPVTVFIGKGGKVLSIHDGAYSSQAEFFADIDRYIGK